MVKVAPAARQKRERKKNFMAKNFSLSYGMNRDCANPYGVCGQKDRFPREDDKELSGKSGRRDFLASRLWHAPESKQ
jgi:hypothetical protein